MENIVEEALQELFIAITARWRKDDGTLAIGVTRSRLLKAGDIGPEVFDDLLDKLKKSIKSLGMELVEYLYEGDVWYSVRSAYVCPSEMTGEQESVLAVIISILENSLEDPKSVPLATLKKRLVTGKYFSEYQLERIIRQLERLGYVHKKNKALIYSPRILLEFPDEARRHIAEEAKRLIF